MGPLEGDKSEKIPKSYEGFDLKGKKKLNREQEKVIRAIQNIHKTIGWDLTDDRISIRRYLENFNRSVFAVSKDGEIVGYATAKKIDDKNYYLSFIAVDKEKQTSDIGRVLLLRIFEKVKKKGGERIVLDYEDSEILNKFYDSDKIPYARNIRKHDHRFRGTGSWVNIIEYDLTKQLEEKPSD